MGVEDRSPVRLAIVGCGAAAELCHLPAAAWCSSVRMAALVDAVADRARGLAAKFGVPRTAADYRDVLGEVDGVVLALPNRFHAPMAIDCLGRGIGVLVEKPMATSSVLAHEMVDAARKSGAPLAVGLMYRFGEAKRFIDKVLQEDWMGELRSVDVEWGGPMEFWPTQSAAQLVRELAGGGALLDYGSHLLDLLLGWFGPPTDVACEDDSCGGIEADAQLTLAFSFQDKPLPCTILVSRLRALRNRIRIVGAQWTLEYDLDSADGLRLTLSDRKDWPLFATSAANRDAVFLQLYAAQLERFASMIRGTVPKLDDSAFRSVEVLELVERAYSVRRARMPAWLAYQEGRP